MNRRVRWFGTGRIKPSLEDVVRTIDTAICTPDSGFYFFWVILEPKPRFSLDVIYGWRVAPLAEKYFHSPICVKRAVNCKQVEPTRILGYVLAHKSVQPENSVL